MIDLHSHLLPGCDDGAADLEMALTMARRAVDDGVRVMACTPHILPGLYSNDATGIEARVASLRQALGEADIDLTLVVGADVHIAPDLPKKLGDGTIPTLNGSRYFLLEPPHQVLPPQLENLIASLIGAGFVPIMTHPERLAWTRTHYDVVDRINAAGCLIQITAGSLTGCFGRTAQYLADRMLDDGRVDIIASDAHNLRARAPGLSKAREIVAARHGRELAEDLVIQKPMRILRDLPVAPHLASSRAAKFPTSQPAGEIRPFSRLFEWIRSA
ncbi:tyrosine-protein phosphatase [Pseudaminobacter soli (ex Li et al. 2025)]|uniref:protein-tyrosine-phosphatase n=1 Tax=Pseudaminobacter soli (ex Li et al. 2025) TaxID=1295366 RepID=A0A2P7SGQ7_9HYPH|nr:CpsB/CapC family capsule biosynthesis tyrosine phosphatase [Mesorhizobium soli]PSJ61511.1 capsular biosynthesis protein [Mesorhizobium soli]